MHIREYRHPVLFYGLATIIPWAFWFAAAYLSHITPEKNIHVIARSILSIVGLFSPMIIAFIMMLSDSELKKDLWSRIFNYKSVKPFYLFITLFLMLGSILLAQLISLAFGHSSSQFNFAEHFSFTAGIFPAWFLLFIAPLTEELAWHSYGTDCLRTRFNLFKTSMMFGIYWALWHFPLAFIKGYYHSNVAESGWLYSLNFVVSLIPYVIIMNWLYYKTNRNIMVAIIFHITAGFFNEIFATHPDSKVIQTILLLILSIYLVIKNRDFFFKLEYQE